MEDGSEPAAITEVKQITTKKAAEKAEQKTLNLWQEKYKTIA